MAAAKKSPKGLEVVKAIVESMAKEDSSYRYPLPTSVRVLGRDVSITSRTDAAFEDEGEYDHNTCSIHVKAGQVEVEEMDTLLHETLHSIDYWLDLGLEERQVRLLATALIGIFQDNPDFAEFVTRPLKGINL